MKHYAMSLLTVSLAVFLGVTSWSQEPETLSDFFKQRKKKKALAKSVESTTETKVNDSNTPLHLLQPEYSFSYNPVTAEDVKNTINKVYKFLDKATPAKLEDANSKEEITDYNKIDRNSRLKRGDFRLTSYEWGVTYSGMMRLAETSGEKKYLQYVTERFNFLSQIAPHFKNQLNEVGIIDPFIYPMLKPHALDDAGAMCASMIKALIANKDLTGLRPLIDNYINYIMHHEYRLKDGTFARNRPHRNTVWLDDMYMSIPAIVNMGKLTGEQKYYDEAAKQVLQFKKRMWVEEKNLFRHGWVESMGEHPSFFWGRANGWAMLTLCEVLDVLPKQHQSYNEIMELLKLQIKGITALQSGQGLWHQLLDRNDSYLETSATAIFVFGIAHAINMGWIDGVAYGPVANLGWAAITKKINEDGQVTGTCVGTGMAFDPAFYYHRPVNVFAAHGYGPVLLAAAEMIELTKRMYPKMNDSGLQYYNEPQLNSAPIFFVQDGPELPLKPGSTRKNNNPVVFIIGDSTGKTGRGKGENGQWGWGSFFDLFFDTSQISIENHALGGRSSRTYITEGHWDKVLHGLKKGDYLIVQFGHNDGGPLNTGRARASLKGTGDEFETVIMERHGGPEDVYTFGKYIRTYIKQARAQGVNVVVLSHTPGNRWTDGKVDRCDQTYGKWSQEVALKEGVYYIDVNDLAAKKYEEMGPEATSSYFIDNVHTSAKGAILHGKCLVEGILNLENCSLAKYVNKQSLNQSFKVANKPLFRDPVFDGAADPVIIWNSKQQSWFMFYTNRRAKLEQGTGVEWVHGTQIGIAESTDGGASWNYKGTANIKYGGANVTYWAPDVIENNGKYHMFLTVVPGIFSDWKHNREIVHLTSNNLIDWDFESKLPLVSDKVIDAAVIKGPDGSWKLYYNNERDRKSIYYAQSNDLYSWTDKGKVVGERGEGPKVFAWKGRYFMVVDTWDGLAVYSSDNMVDWKRQSKNILKEAGSGVDDKTKGLHADVLVNNDRAFVFYFTHPGRFGDKAKEDNYETRRSSIQVAELELKDGEIICDRNKPVLINLKH